MGYYAAYTDNALTDVSGQPTGLISKWQKSQTNSRLDYVDS